MITQEYLITVGIMIVIAWTITLLIVRAYKKSIKPYGKSPYQSQLDRIKLLNKRGQELIKELK